MFKKYKGNWRIGEFVDGLLTGKGAILDKNGNIEENIFKNNMFQKTEKINDFRIKNLIKMKKREIEKEKNKIENLNDANSNEDISISV